MDISEGSTDFAPGPLELGLLANMDAMKRGYELLRSILTGEQEIPEGVDISEECESLIGELETSHMNALGMAYTQTNALDRLRRGLCAVYGLDYEKLIAKEGTPDDDVLPGERAEFPENFE